MFLSKKGYPFLHCDIFEKFPLASALSVCFFVSGLLFIDLQLDFMYTFLSKGRIHHEKKLYWLCWNLYSKNK